MNFLETQEFSIMQPVGVNVIAFYIVYSDFEKGVPLCRLEKIDYMDNAVDGKIERRFTVLEDEDKELDLVIISLSKQRYDVVFAKLKNGVLEYTGKNASRKYTDIVNYEEQEEEYRFRFNPLKQMVFIDSVTGEQVLPIIESKKSNEYRMGKYKLIKDRLYIVIELKIKS